MKFSVGENNTYDYAFKFEDRKEFERMKTKSKTEEIIIVKIIALQTSYTNLLFLKDEKWYTLLHLLNGVMRQHLLATKKIKKQKSRYKISKSLHFQLINSMNDF